MRFAYADPPYFKNGKIRYGEHHPEAGKWDTKEAHINLIGTLIEEYDGFAYSSNPKDLHWILPEYPELRVCAWVKTFHQIRPTTVQYAWEIVLLHGGRKDNKRKPMVRDWFQGNATRKKGLPGAKSLEFNTWILQLLNYQKGDELDDIFPGTGGMAEAIKKLEEDDELEK
jgi:hypothetical protein